MKNEHPVPVRCALCKTEALDAFDVGRCWVQSGTRLYVVCTTCIEEREVVFEFDATIIHPSTVNGPAWGGATFGATVARGKPTLSDIEKRLDDMDKRLDDARKHTDTMVGEIRRRYDDMHRAWVAGKLR